MIRSAVVKLFAIQDQTGTLFRRGVLDVAHSLNAALVCAGNPPVLDWVHKMAEQDAFFAKLAEQDAFFAKPATAPPSPAADPFAPVPDPLLDALYRVAELLDRTLVHPLTGRDIVTLPLTAPDDATGDDLPGVALYCDAYSRLSARERKRFRTLAGLRYRYGTEAAHDAEHNPPPATPEEATALLAGMLAKPATAPPSEPSTVVKVKILPLRDDEESWLDQMRFRWAQDFRNYTVLKEQFWNMVDQRLMPDPADTGEGAELARSVLSFWKTAPSKRVQKMFRDDTLAPPSQPSNVTPFKRGAA
jgi:hypothetical protein